MLKKTLSVIAGLIAASVIIFNGEHLIFAKFPVLGQFNAINNWTIAQQKLLEVPKESWYYLFLIWIISAFVCGFLIKLISHSSKNGLPIFCGAFLLLGAVQKFFERPHPMLVILAAILIFIPITYLGFKMCKVHTMSREEEEAEEEKDLA
jgi:hypothetical protein